jgi:hypothetical protein
MVLRSVLLKTNFVVYEAWQRSTRNTSEVYFTATDTINHFKIFDYGGGFSKIATSSSVPRPRQPVEAPTFCDVSDDISVRIFATKVGSVRGVKSSRLGNC